MSDRTDERIDDLVALAALGEMTAADEAELDALLAEDVALAGEVDEALEAAALLQGEVAEMPPTHLRAAVLAMIAETPQSSAESDVAQGPVADERRTTAPVTDLSERRRSRWIPALSAAAALVLLAGVGIVFVRSDTSDTGVAEQVENVVAADDAVTRVLEGELAGDLTVVYSPGEEALVIDGEGLPVLGEDRAFVLWFVDDDDDATPVQIFRPDAAGDVLVRVDDVDPTDFVLGITEEDAGGADTPTEPIIASA